MGVVMAVTKLSSDHHVLKYNITSTGGGGAVNIDAAGAATPDLLTDSVFNSPLYNRLATAAATQAAAQAIVFSGTDIIVYAAHRDADANWLVQANTDGSNRVRLTVTSAAEDTVGLILTIVYRHTLGR